MPARPALRVEIAARPAFPGLYPPPLLDRRNPVDAIPVIEKRGAARFFSDAENPPPAFERARRPLLDCRKAPPPVFPNEKNLRRHRLPAPATRAPVQPVRILAPFNPSRYFWAGDAYRARCGPFFLSPEPPRRARFKWVNPPRLPLPSPGPPFPAPACGVRSGLKEDAISPTRGSSVKPDELRIGLITTVCVS